MSAQGRSRTHMPEPLKGKGTPVSEAATREEVRAAPDPLAAAADLHDLLDAWPAPQRFIGDGSAPTKARLFDRVRRALDASAGFTTLRGAAARSWLPLADGVQGRVLYEATGTPQRPGEPLRARLIELAAGARWSLVAGQPREWLVLHGEVQIGTQTLRGLGYCADEGAVATLCSADGALLYLREAARTDAEPATQHDDPALWLDFAPGIRRRLLWTDGAQAAMLYASKPGAVVPHHGHHHDEECLMLTGEIFLDDMLLREGEYQLAPAGTSHQGVTTDTGCLLFAHGDLELALR